MAGYVSHEMKNMNGRGMYICIIIWQGHAYLYHCSLTEVMHYDAELVHMQPQLLSHVRMQISKASSLG